MNKIIIRNFLLPISIGIYDKEKKDPQNVLLNIELQVLPVVTKDDISTVVHYGEVVQKIQKIAEEKHINLLETLAEKILSVCFSYESVTGAVVRAEKIDIFDTIDGIGVELSKTR